MFALMLLSIIALAIGGLMFGAMTEKVTTLISTLSLIILVCIMTLMFFLPNTSERERLDDEIKALQKLCVDAGIATFTPVVTEKKFTILATGSVNAEKEQ